MNEVVRRQIRGFLSSTLRHTTMVNAVDVENWLARSISAERLSASREKPDLPPHGGPRALLEYQSEVAARAINAVSEKRSCLIGLPTGSGKTFTAIRVLFSAIDLGLDRILWLAPQTLLLEQAEHELRRSWWTVPQRHGLFIRHDLNRLQDEKDGAEIHFSTLQRLTSQDRTDLDPQLVVVDEAHHCEANEFGRAVSKLAAAGAVLLGLSATPGRNKQSEFEALVGMFGRSLVVPPSLGSDPVESLVRAGVYSQLSHERILPTRLTESERVSTRLGRVSSRPAIAAQSPGRMDACIDRMRRLSASQRAVIFGYSSGHCHVIAAGLHASGITVEVVGSNEPIEANAMAVSSFAEGETQCLVNVRYVAVGADFPAANVAVLTVPLGSPILFEQILGRVTRGPAVGGTRNALLIDFDDHLGVHGEAQSYARFRGDWV